VSSADSVLATLQAMMKDGSPYPPLTIETTMPQPLVQALGDLAPPDVSGFGCTEPAQVGSLPWYPSYGDQTYWDDTGSTFSGGSVTNGYGPQNPSKYQALSSTIFNYYCVLPQYLTAVSIFLAVGAFDSDFVTKYNSTLTNTTCALQSVYAYIYGTGLTKLSPGPVSHETLTAWLAMGHPFELAPVNPYPPGVIFLSLDGITVSGMRIEYGVVEMFSGYSSVGILTLETPFNSGFNYPSLLQIRQLKRWKDVYVGTGLGGNMEYDQHPE
jgi:hypothetical protein